MATIVLTSNTTTKNHHPSHHPEERQHRVSVSSLYSNCTMRESHRDPIDICLDVLKCVIKYSRISGIRHAAKIGSFKRIQKYLATLCHFGLLVETAITKRCKSKNKNTDRHEIRTIKRYYVTPKGYSLMRLYDVMIDLLIPF